MEEGVDSKWKDVHHLSDPVKIINMPVIQPLYLGLDS